jgi:cell division transport system permease protein
MQFFKLARQNFFRNFWLTLTSIIIMVLMLFSLTMIYTFNVLGQKILVSFKDKMDLGIYLEQNIDQNQLALLRTDLENMSEIKEIKYLSPQESLEQFREKHQDDPLILKSLEELNKNPLGGVITLKFYQPEDYQKVINLVNQPAYQPLIQEQNFYDYQNLIESFKKINQKITESGLFLSTLFALISILVIFTTIKLGALSRQKEIKIMRLVGASAWTIRGPFLIEGSLYAFSSWLINSGLVIGLAYLTQPQLNKFLQVDFDLFTYFTSQALFFWLGLFLFSLIISLIGSSLAIKKYLKI